MASFITVDVSGIRDCAAALRKAARKLPAEHRIALQEGGELIANTAKAKSSWSTQIPRSVQARSIGPLTSVTADAPNAAPLENRGRQGTFKHPVFGNQKNIVSQKARPFLHPAAEASGPFLVDNALEHVGKVMTEAGFD
jgi:hypothetical protein